MKTKKQYIKQLRIARKAAGLSQKALADKAGLAEGTITFYETGRRNIPIEVYKKLMTLCHAQIQKNLELARL